MASAWLFLGAPSVKLARFSSSDPSFAARSRGCRHSEPSSTQALPLFGPFQRGSRSATDTARPMKVLASSARRFARTWQEVHERLADLKPRVIDRELFQRPNPRLVFLRFNDVAAMRKAISRTAVSIDRLPLGPLREVSDIESPIIAQVPEITRWIGLTVLELPEPFQRAWVRGNRLAPG
jgi:hypothetical protein